MVKEWSTFSLDPLTKSDIEANLFSLFWDSCNNSRGTAVLCWGMAFTVGGAEMYLEIIIKSSNKNNTVL